MYDGAISRNILQTKQKRKKKNKNMTKILYPGNKQQTKAQVKRRIIIYV